MTNSDLKQRAEKIIALMDQADEIKTEIADRFQDAKNQGFTVAALRKAIKVARLDGDKRAKHESAQLDFEMYLSEIEGGLNKPRLQVIKEHGDKVVAKFSEALDERARSLREAAS